MKKIKSFTVLLFVCSLVLTNCTQQEDFVVDQQSRTLDDISNVTILDYSGNSENRVTTDYLKTKWESIIKEEDGLTVKLEKFIILQSFDEDKKEQVFFLKTTSKDNTLETGAFLIKVSNNVYRLGPKKCSCTGCPNGCNLVVEGSKCRCTDCGNDTNKSCTKTEEIIIEG